MKRKELLKEEFERFSDTLKQEELLGHCEELISVYEERQQHGSN